MLRYNSALIASAERPVVISIGRFTWRAVPLSAPMMLRLQAAAMRSPVERVAALAVALRAAFPWRWWFRFRDPVRVILQLPSDLRDKVLAALLSVPGTDRDGTRDEDPIERMRREQRAAVYGKEAAGPSPTLASALVVVRAAYGDAWYFNPARWTTADGYAPFKVVWCEYVGLQSLEARARLSQSDSYALATATDHHNARRARQQLITAAFPAEPQPVH